MAEARDLPLFRWGEELRRTRLRRARLHRRAGFLAGGVACLMATIVLPPRPRLVWNASASAPIGLYRVEPGASVRAGDMVVARPPDAVRALAASRRYLPTRVPLVKRVAADAGAIVCARGSEVRVGSALTVLRLRTDGKGRPLPWWEGCRRLRAGELFLLMPEVPDSFDGRYFGVTEAGDVVGKAVLLWRR